MNLYGYEFVREDELKHYGLKGMHWGTRRWQNYDATNTFNEAGIERYFGRTPGKNSQAVKEPKIYYKKSIQAKNSKHSKSGVSISKDEMKDAKRATKILAMSPEESEKLAKIAKIAGISLATTAGIMAVGYIAYKYGPDIKSYLSNPQAFKGVLDSGYNADRNIKTGIGLTDELFNNAFNDDPIGSVALERGFGFITGDQIAESISNPTNLGLTEGEIAQKVKDITVNLRTAASSRRLSCWPGSNAYYMSMMTGEDYVSRSFTNLAKFSDFGKLYTTPPKIFNVSGKAVSDFVGRWGRGYARADIDTTKSLISSIFKNISEADNLTPDGSRTIGFINAAYGGTTCTHEWNFDLVHKAEGLKELIISDTYDGSRYSIASMTSSGNISYTSNLGHFLNEMHHYNARSVRFYAPKVESINTDMMANVILGKTGEGAASQVNDLITNIDYGRIRALFGL